MNAPKHTQGPWIADGSTIITKATGLKPNRTRGYGCGNDFIACLNDGEYHEYSDGVEQEANARLIAAAPDYDAAARKMVEALVYAPDEVIAGAFGDDVYHALSDLRAAIAKATGEAL